MPTASYNKFNSTIEDVFEKKIDFSTDTLRVLLTNAAPSAADTVVDTTTSTCTVKSTSNAAEIAAGNGYTKKGAAVTVTTSAQSAGTYTLAANQVVFTASGGTIGPLRYAVLYSDTSGTTSTRSVVSWWDYASSVTLNDGDTFTVQFNGANPGTIFTAA
jgi:hypothetical protein